MKTNVYAFLNIARTGIVTQNELADMTQIDPLGVAQAIANNPGFIVGLKARMSSSVVGKNGIQPLLRAKDIQRQNNKLPLMVHIGNNPPNLDEIADLLESGDIITHCFNGKPNRILTPRASCAMPSNVRLSAACASTWGTGRPALVLPLPR